MSSRLRRGRLIAWGAGVASLACLALLVQASWTIILEKYYLHQLGATDESARLAAVRSLGWLDRAEGIRKLIEVADMTGGGVRLAAIDPLGRTRHHREQVARVLVALLAASEDDKVSEAAVKAAAEFGPEIVPFLLERSWTPGGSRANVFIRGGRRLPMPGPLEPASEVLRRIGPAAVPPLISAQQDKRSTVRNLAETFVLSLGPIAVPPLADALRSSGDRGLRRIAVRTLGMMGEAAEGAATDLSAVVSDKESDAELRLEAVSALGSIRPQASCAIAALAECGLADEESRIRRTSAEALAAIGQGAESAAERLIQRACDRDEVYEVRYSALHALWTVPLPEGTLVDSLLALSKNPEENDVLRTVASRLLPDSARRRARVTKGSSRP